MYETRVLSGMRPTGSLHLGHFHGVLKNWVRLQPEYTCLFFAADWHALTTDYENPVELQKNTWDMVIDCARYVPVGEDQVPHVEFTRELARRFNHLYGREPGYEDKAKAAVKKMGTKKARLLDEQQNLSRGDRERLYGWLEGGGKKILVEPEVLLTEAPRMPGLDGQKMSKSYGNTISLREEPESVAKKIRTMPTDPARVKRGDPGNPEKCPVWELHKVYSDEERKKWVWQGCTTAGIGCLECKQPVIEAIQAELAPMRERAQAYVDDPTLVKNIIADGCDKAKRLAAETMRDVREAMGLSYT